MAETVVKARLEFNTKDAETNLGNLTTKFGKLAVIAGGALATKQILEYGSAFETSFAKASTLIDENIVDMEALEKGILDLSKTSGIASSDLNEGLYQALSAGVPISEDSTEALEFLEEATRLAKGGFTDITTAIDSTTSVINAYGLGLDSADDIMNILIKTQNKGKTTVDELGKTISNVTPFASALGVGFDQVGASLASITAQGTDTATATTQLKSLFAEFSKETSVGSKALKDLTGKSFKELIGEGKTVGDILLIMQKGAKDSGKDINNLFGNVRAGAAALSLTNKDSEKFNDALSTMRDDTDAVSEAFETMTDTTDHQMSVALNSLKVVFVELFIALSPLINLFTDFVGMLSESSTASTIAKIIILALVVGMVALTASAIAANLALLPFTGTILAIIAAIGFMVGAVIFLINEWGNLSKTMKVVVGIILFMLGPIGLLIAAAALIIKNWEPIKAFFKDLWSGLGDGLVSTANFIINVLNGLLGAIEGLINGAMSGFNSAIGLANKIPGVNIPLIGNVSIPKIPALASGGITTGATLAMIGEGAEQEAVLPLSKLDSLINTSPNMNMQPNLNVEVVMGSNFDMDNFMELFVQKVRLNQ
jgi:TP901 family phage tail tape measure protein